MNYNVVKKELQADLEEATKVSLGHCQNLRHFRWSAIFAGKTEKTEILKMAASQVVLSLYQQLSPVSIPLFCIKICDGTVM